MADSFLTELDKNIKQSQNAIDLNKCLSRLASNKDFERVVLNGYFEKEAIRLVHSKSSADNHSVERQQSIISQIDAIGFFSKYLTDIMYAASLAVKNMEADEKTRDEIIFEDLTNV